MTSHHLGAVEIPHGYQGARRLVHIVELMGGEFLAVHATGYFTVTKDQVKKWFAEEARHTLWNLRAGVYEEVDGRQAFQKGLDVAYHFRKITNCLFICER